MTRRIKGSYKKNLFLENWYMNIMVYDRTDKIWEFIKYATYESKGYDYNIVTYICIIALKCNIFYFKKYFENIEVRTAHLHQSVFHVATVKPCYSYFKPFELL